MSPTPIGWGFIPLLLLLFLSAEGVAENHEVLFPLDNGAELLVREMPFSRILPHAYYDQAISSIPGVFPGSEILAGRRVGYIRKDPPLLYSLVCYKKKDDDIVVINGTITTQTRAWFFETVSPVDEYVSTLLLVIETISNELE